MAIAKDKKVDAVTLTAQMEAAKQESAAAESNKAAQEAAGSPEGAQGDNEDGGGQEQSGDGSHEGGDDQGHDGDSATEQVPKPTVPEGAELVGTVHVLALDDSRDGIAAAINAIPESVRMDVTEEKSDYEKTLVVPTNAVDEVIPPFNAEEAADSGISGNIVQGAQVDPGIPVASVFQEPSRRNDAAPMASFPSHYTVSGKAILRTIDNYIQEMALNKPMTEKEGLGYQTGFYRALERMINSLEDDFRDVFTEVLQRFVTHKDGALQAEGVFRYMQNIALSSDQIKTFQYLLNMFHLLADPASRSVNIKQCNVVATLGVGSVITEQGRNRVMAYFKL
jgi:hypothetical protein